MEMTGLQSWEASFLKKKIREVEAWMPEGRGSLAEEEISEGMVEEGVPNDNEVRN